MAHEKRAALLVSPLVTTMQTESCPVSTSTTPTRSSAAVFASLEALTPHVAPMSPLVIPMAATAAAAAASDSAAEATPLSDLLADIATDRARAQLVFEDLQTLSLVGNNQKIHTGGNRIRIDSSSMYMWPWLQAVYRRWIVKEDRHNSVDNLERHFRDVFHIARKETNFRLQLLRLIQSPSSQTMRMELESELRKNKRFIQRIIQAVMESKTGLTVLETTTYAEDKTVQARIRVLKQCIDDDLATLRENLEPLNVM